MEIPSADKIVKTVVVILPGFLVLGLFSYATDLHFDEYVFTYIALALSVGIHLLGDYFLGIINRVLAWRGAAWTAGVKIYALLVAVLGFGAALLLTYLYDTEALLAPMRLVTHKISHEVPLGYVLRRNLHRADICGIDLRPRDWWAEKSACPLPGAAPGGTPAARYSYHAFARVFLKGGKIYEGDPRYWEIRDKDYQLALVRVCEVEKVAGAEKIIPVNGPAVVLFSGEISHIEFIEELKSPCRTLLNDGPPVPVKNEPLAAPALQATPPPAKAP